MSVFIQGVITAAAGALVLGIIAAIKLLSRMAADVKSLGPSMQALYSIQPHLIRATRYQNAALREIGANGSTEEADKCLNAAEECLDRRLVERVGGCA